MNSDQHPAVTTTARHLQRVDHTDQSYPPHGSANAVDVRHHVDFTVSGTITRGKDHVYFDLTCTTA
jgi:hypothetical protein